MLFMHIHTHTAENCIVDDLKKQMNLTSQLRENFQKAGITVTGAYVAQHEHTRWYLLEANNIRELEMAPVPNTLFGDAGLISIDTQEFSIIHGVAGNDI